MKILTRLFLLLLLLALVLPLWIKRPDGRAIMVVEDWLGVPRVLARLLPAGVAELQGVERSAPEQAVTPGDVAEEPAAESDGMYYRWQDERGVWHFSDQPPPEGVSADYTRLPHAENTLGESAALAVDSAGSATPMDSNIAPAPGLPEGVSREAMEQMLEEAHRRRMGEEL